MDYCVRISELMDKNNGFLQTDAVTKANIPRVYIKEMEKRGELYKAERGIYLKVGTVDDELYRTIMKYKGVIFSHGTAMKLHGMLKDYEAQPTVTVKTGINPTKLKQRGYKVFTIKDDLMDVGAIMMETPQGNTVKTYTIERTVCDIVRSRNQLGDNLLALTLNEYFTKEDRDEEKLMEMAEIFHICNIIEDYKRVLILK